MTTLSITQFCLNLSHKPKRLMRFFGLLVVIRVLSGAIPRLLDRDTCLRLIAVTLTFSTGSVAAAATPTLIRWGIYNVDSADNCTDLAASTANDTTLLAATQTQYSKALQAPWSKVIGKRYAFAQIVVSAATMPLMCGFTVLSNSLVQQFALQTPRRFARLLGQTDLPASILTASMNQASYRIGVIFT